jgi:hypothetical protein
MTVDITPSTISKLKKAREIEEERRRISALAKAKADMIAKERARLEEAQRVIHVIEDDAVDELIAGLTRQSLLLEDASQDGLTAEQMIAKLLLGVTNQEKLMRSELENRRELQSLRQSMQCTEAEKLQVPLTAKSQQIQKTGGWNVIHLIHNQCKLWDISKPFCSQCVLVNSPSNVLICSSRGKLPYDWDTPECCRRVSNLEEPK